MNSVQLPFLVEGILMSVCALSGMFLGRSGKPYGKGKLIVHLFFFAWFTTGFGFIQYGLFTPEAMKETVLWIPVGVMGLMILVQFVTGVIMMASKAAEKKLWMIHAASAILMLLSDVGAFIIAGIRS